LCFSEKMCLLSDKDLSVTEYTEMSAIDDDNMKLRLILF
jgi:hypothetical protein